MSQFWGFPMKVVVSQYGRFSIAAGDTIPIAGMWATLAKIDEIDAYPIGPKVEVDADRIRDGRFVAKN